MMTDFQQRQLITEIVGKAIDSGKIKFDAPLMTPIVQESK